MKDNLLLIIVVMILIVFTIKLIVPEPTKEELTMDWLSDAPKPITCLPLDTTDNKILYLLVHSNDSCSYEYITGHVKLNLPDTIK